MKLTPVWTILVLTIVLSSTTETRSTCKRFLSKNLHCWASCDLANCGKIHSNPEAFIECSWTLSDSSDFDRYNFTVYLHNNHYEYIACDPTSSSCNLTEGNCSAKFLLSNCTLLRDVSEYVVATLNFKKRKNSLCTENQHFKICLRAKPDPPCITDVILDEESQLLRIITSNDTCTDMHLDYKLTYLRTNGITTPRPVSTDQPVIPYKEASLYNYSLQYTKGGKIHSDPRIGSFLTKPATAVDGQARVLCRVINGTTSISISWRKCGLIDYFLVKLGTRGNNSDSHEVQVSSKLKNQTEHRVDVTGFRSDLNKAYELTITAYNAEGKSRTHRRQLSRIHCRAPPELHCELKETQQHSITVKCDVNRKKAKLEVEFRHHGSGKVYRTESTDPRGQITQDSLKECSQYDISVSATIDDIKQGFCKLKGSTLPPAPEVEVKESSRKLHIQIQKSTRTICGNNITYTGYYYISNMDDTKREFQIDKGQHAATIRHLQPNTEYVVFVAVNNGASSENSRWFHKSVWTSEAAPDEPPKITTSTRTSTGINIAWTQPMNKNGRITNYEILVHKNGSVREGLVEACHSHSLGYLCVYEADKNFVLMKGHDEARNVSIRACAVNRTECSTWSEPSVIEDHEESSELLVVLCAVCGAMMLLVVIVGVIYRCRSTGPQPMRPQLHPNVLNGIKQESEEHKRKEDLVDVIRNF